MDEIVRSVLAGVTSGGVIAAVLGTILLRRTTMIQAQIRSEFERQAAIFESTRGWKERTVAELLGPVFMQLDRTDRAFRRWRDKNLYLEARVIGVGNAAIRDLLLQHADLVPPDLLDDAGKLIEHYDRWLEEFDRVRGAGTPASEEPFVFVGPEGFPFPRASADKFPAAFKAYWRELYG